MPKCIRKIFVQASVESRHSYILYIGYPNQNYQYLNVYFSKQDVPSANFEMHTIHCKRFLTPCPQCGESVNKNQLQEHIDENHAQVCYSSILFQINFLQ